MKIMTKRNRKDSQNFAPENYEATCAQDKALEVPNHTDG